MKFQHLISCKQVFSNFEKLFHVDLNYYPFQLKVIIFLYISLVVLDIRVDKLVVFFLTCSFMLMYLTIMNLRIKNTLINCYIFIPKFFYFFICKNCKSRKIFRPQQSMIMG